MDLITGLPWHPLIIHGVVVLMPLAALGVLLVMFIPKIRHTYSPLVLGTLYVATIFAFLATQSGEALAERVGLPNSHAIQGERLLNVAVAFSILFTIWFALEYLDRIRKAVPSAIKPVLNVIIPITAIASIVLTVLVGHSGAEASWKNRIAQTQPAVLEPTSPTPTSPASPTGTINLTAAEIATHNSRSDCWSIVRGNVYNLTSYVQKHPGGASVIANICGKDGSRAFTNFHNSQSKPNNVLSGFLLGAVDSTISSGVAQKVTPPATPKPTNSTKPTKPTNSTGPINLSTSEIQTHNSRSDCWSIVRGNVYNLTSYVQKHPGGASVIANICGKDGSGAFTNQHNSQSKPNNVLSGFFLGAVDSTISSGVAEKVIAPPAGGSANESGEESDDD
jgi:cytochrome b involved in lipid metabolism